MPDVELLVRLTTWHHSTEAYSSDGQELHKTGETESGSPYYSQGDSDDSGSGRGSMPDASAGAPFQGSWEGDLAKDFLYAKLGVSVTAFTGVQHFGFKWWSEFWFDPAQDSRISRLHPSGTARFSVFAVNTTGNPQSVLFDSLGGLKLEGPAMAKGNSRLTAPPSTWAIWNSQTTDMSEVPMTLAPGQTKFMGEIFCKYYFRMNPRVANDTRKWKYTAGIAVNITAVSGELAVVPGDRSTQEEGR
jgi:hypothetical protein